MSNKEKRKESKRKYYEKNKESIRIKQKKYRKNNSNNLKIIAKIWRDRNKDKIKIYNKKYNMENKDEINAKKKKYRERDKDKIKKYRNDNKDVVKKWRERNKDKIIVRDKKYYEESKKNICIVCGGSAPYKFCTKKCMGIGWTGKNNPMWKDGATPINQKIRTSKEYKLWRTAVFERDDYTCIWCGQVGGKLNADHIKSFALFPELRFAIDNGRTLCEACHRTTDTYGGKSKLTE